MLGPQSRFLLDVPVTHLLRFEELPRCLESLPFLAGRVRLGHAEATRSAPYRLRDYYDVETMRLVRIYAGGDFLLYGYDPEKLPGA